MSKTYIIYNGEKVIIGFKNSNNEFDYTIYYESDGGTIENFDISEMINIAEEEGIDDDIMEIKEIRK